MVANGYAASRIEKHGLFRECDIVKLYVLPIFQMTTTGLSYGYTCNCNKHRLRKSKIKQQTVIKHERRIVSDAALVSNRLQPYGDLTMSVPFIPASL